ncbi:MAG: polyprenyl diphosphate synthase [Candidatus Moranbacteria bacterium]|nr:polyprenyl diphosphate synthase [Candidatus Moranbacteria bacterium]
MKSDNLPVHVAIIPDGNRHWARERGLKPWEGHEAGAKNTEKLVRKAQEAGIKCFSFWGSSIQNLRKRPMQERRNLLRIYEKYLSKLIDSDDVHKNQVRINIIGKWEEFFPERLKKIIRECARKTAHYKQFFLNIMLAYSGDDEMLEAVKKIVKSEIPAAKISFETIKENLLTKDLPPVDLLIRTGGEPHLSVGFMMWDIANAQLYFPDKFYPDFDEKEFEKAIREYQRRERRHGK